MQPRELSPGSVVLGRYTVQKVLGRGGMATVYLAKHQQTERLVALKLLDPELSRDPSYVERFRREARAAGRVRSDFVVAIYDLDAEVGGGLVLVMEYLEGQSVQQAIRGGRLPIQKVLSFGRHMLEGLAAAHAAGVIHRDLKPANLFIEKSSTGTEKCKILDFGISKLADASQQELTKAGQTLGTVAYMAPEQIRGKASPTDPRVDLYSAGVTLFLMLTGKRPIDAEDTVQLLAAVLENPPLTLAQAVGLPFPSPLEQFIAKALQKDPDRRFQSAMEMRDALVEAGKSVGYEATGPLELPVGGPAAISPSGREATPAPVGMSGVRAKTQPHLPAAGAPARHATMMGVGAQAAPPAPPPQAAPMPPPGGDFDPFAQTMFESPPAGPPPSAQVTGANAALSPPPSAGGGLYMPPSPQVPATHVPPAPDAVGAAPAKRSVLPIVALGGVGVAAIAIAGVLFLGRRPAAPSQTARPAPQVVQPLGGQGNGGNAVMQAGAGALLGAQPQQQPPAQNAQGADPQAQQQAAQNAGAAQQPEQQQQQQQQALAQPQQAPEQAAQQQAQQPEQAAQQAQQQQAPEQAGQQRQAQQPEQRANNAGTQQRQRNNAVTNNTNTAGQAGQTGQTGQNGQANPPRRRGRVRSPGVIDGPPPF